MGKKKKRKEKIVYIERPQPIVVDSYAREREEQTAFNFEPKVEREAPPIKNLGGIKAAAESVTPLEAIQGLFEQIGKLRQENPLPEPTPEQREEAAKRLQAFKRAMQMPGETVLEHLKRVGVGYELDYKERILTINIDELARVEDEMKSPEHAVFQGHPPEPEPGTQVTPVIDLGKEHDGNTAG